MSRSYTHVQELLTSVMAMKGKGCTYRPIADQFGLSEERIEELSNAAGPAMPVTSLSSLADDGRGSSLDMRKGHHLVE